MTLSFYSSRLHLQIAGDTVGIGPRTSCNLGSTLLSYIFTMKPTDPLDGGGVLSSLRYSYQNAFDDCQSFGMGLYKKPTHLQRGFCFTLQFWSFCFGVYVTAKEGMNVHSRNVEIRRKLAGWRVCSFHNSTWDQTQVAGLAASFNSPTKPSVLGMVVNTFNCSIWEAKTGRSEFEDSLVYNASPRTARATQTR